MIIRNAIFPSIFAGMFILGAVFFGARQGVKAQVITANVPCTALSYNLRYGQYDAVAVTNLQVFLNAEGYLLHVPTGYFGPLTYQAVLNFQAAYGILRTGFVGPITRAEIQALSCINPNPNPTPLGVSIFSIDPALGSVGTQVTLSGRWFDSDNTVYFGGNPIVHVAASPGVAIACTTDPSCVPGIRQTLTFFIPDSIAPYCAPGMYCALYLRKVTPGVYPIYVTNSNGTSNTINFTVIDSSSNNSISISGIDAPNSLPIGTPGTWTVHVVGTASTNLHYSVSWGDQMTASSQIMAPVPGTIQSSATFTHSYAIAGTYHPTFTVSDDLGHSISSNASIVVTPLY